MSVRSVEAIAAILLLLSVMVTLRPRLLLACVVALLAAAWWPLNNGVLEGATLIAVTARHGLTVNDLLGILGFACAISAVVRAPATVRAKRICCVGMAVLLVAGISTAFLTGG